MTGLPPVLELFLTISLVLWAACGLAEFVSATFTHLGPPYTTPLMQEFFPDFTFFKPRFARLHQLSFFSLDLPSPYMYPATAVLPYAFFFSRTLPLTDFLATMVVIALGVAAVFAWRFRRAGVRPSSTVLFVAGALLLSYPLAFEFKQANIEIFVWLLVAGGILCFYRGRAYAAASLFGIAGAMKMVPFIYLGLLLSRRRYGPIVLAAAIAVALNVVSLWVLSPDIAATQHKIAEGLTLFRQNYMLALKWGETGFDHSLWMLIKQLPAKLPRTDRLSPYLDAYTAFFGVGGALLYVVRIRRLPVLNQVLCYVTGAIVFPPVSYDYTLLHLYTPWAICCLLAVALAREQRTFRPLWAIFVLFAILMAPESEFIHHGIRLAGVIKTMSLLLLLGIALRYPLTHPSIEPTGPYRV